MRFDSHRPPHYYENNNIVFLTGRILQGEKILESQNKKIIFTKILNNLLKELGLKIYAWVILDNHYHLLFFLPQNANLKNFVNRLHSSTSRILNQNDNTPGRQIWYQYWDHTIRNDADLWKHFNYIHHNPVKHGYVNMQEECADYKFCSYRQWKEKKGADWLDWCFHDYPIADFTTDDEE